MFVLPSGQQIQKEGIIVHTCINYSNSKKPIDTSIIISESILWITIERPVTGQQVVKIKQL